VPPTLRPIEDVTEDLTAAWQADRTQQAVMDEANAVAADIGATTGFETLALVAANEDGLTRRSFVDGTPRGFIQRVFELELGEVTTIDAGDFAVIVRLDDMAIPTADAEAIAADRDVLADTAAAGIAQDVFEIFNAQIQLQTDVNINPQAVTAVHSAFQ